ncbi:hypothetical protein [Fusobacterium varium]|jgi:hypothetical protein
MAIFSESRKIEIFFLTSGKCNTDDDIPGFLLMDNVNKRFMLLELNSQNSQYDTLTIFENEEKYQKNDRTYFSEPLESENISLGFSYTLFKECAMVIKNENYHLKAGGSSRN